jgi:1-acyl-sn-glycerol-3-phosphate acyltransferase
MVTFFLGSIRLLIFLIFVSLLALLFYFASFFWTKDTALQKAMALRNFLIKGLNFILGVRPIIYGNKPSSHGLIVANHRSYFDPVIMLSQTLTCPVGKKEVASWPIIGYLCKISGVIFVDRKDPNSRQETCNRIGEALNRGYAVINFPEGTTHDLPTTVDFTYGSFAIAAKLNAAVIPVAVDYKVPSDAFIGDDTFIPHFLKCFGKLTTEIKITYFDPLYSNDPSYLLTTSKKMIDKELLRFRKEWEEEKLVVNS